MRVFWFGILGATSFTAANPLPQSPSDPRHPIPRPTRPLEWGDVNVLHTTDIHGWISGHSKKVYPEMSWSGNFGDLFSFVKHMRDKANENGQDLLLVDTGDRRIGHGLTDHILDPIEDINGKSVSVLYHDLGYDLVVPGNHDLQNANVVKYAMNDLFNLWGDKYLTSNVQRANGDAMGAHYRRWTTSKGRRMQAFGVVPEKTTVPVEAGLKVIPIKEMIEQEWVGPFPTITNKLSSVHIGTVRLIQFKESIKPDPKDEVKVFVLLGHVDPQPTGPADNISLIYHAIRQKHPLTPILIFTGHTHRRWCRTFSGKGDSVRSMLIQSGQYFDTVGWMSVKLDDNTAPRNLEFSRRYLDNNVETYMYHTDFEREAEFHTEDGKNITNFIRNLEKTESLSEIYGQLESDYFLDRKEWTEEENDKESIFTFYLDAVQASLVDSTKSPNWLFFSNWGMMRGDIYRGPFSKSDLYAISPNASDDNPFLYATVPRRIADQIVKITQQVDKASRRKLVPKSELKTPGALADGSQSYFSLPLPRPVGKTYGWVTKDLCGNNGDDVPHHNIPRVNFDKPKDGLPVYFWRKGYTSELGPEEDVHIIVPNRLGSRTFRKALESLKVESKIQAYREDVKQHDLLERYIKTKFPFKPSPPGKHDA
ncbi:unnamed protein product [Rhizoctonia solani]|uniref:Calcineurin-like phosphoesterase domain-containing protein n=1 Tax=Rhizoctonia solani TaxID=456999 RepID=A0A8H3C562_9AGAM|nr:unnamed protein product [Rhizoctonia solani]